MRRHTQERHRPTWLELKNHRPSDANAVLAERSGSWAGNAHVPSRSPSNTRKTTVVLPSGSELFQQAFAGKWFYVSYFQAPGVAEAEFEADVDRTLRITLAGTPGFDATSPLVQSRKPGDGFLTGAPTPEALPAWLDGNELSALVKSFERSGFRGGLNRYRNMDRDWHELRPGRIELPALFIVGEVDPGRAFAPIEPMQALVPRLEPIVVIPGAGHWLPEEAPSAVNDALLRFLALVR